MNPDAAARAPGADPIAPPVPAADGGEARVLQRLRADVIGHDTVPSAPTVLLEILRLLDDEQADLSFLFAAIERDPGLTARVLRTANASFFGQSRTVATVRHAVTVLGAAMVRSLAVSAAVFQAVGDDLPAAEVDAVWRHSLETAVVARVLAARSGSAERDDAFTAGLLHDAGRLLLWRRFPDLYRTPPAGTALDLAERATIGVDHATAGGWLFDAWQLPPALVAAVAQHHAGAPSHGLPAIVAAANLMVHHPDGAVLLAEPPDAHGATARAAAACCGLTCESWAEIAAGTGGAARS